MVERIRILLESRQLTPTQFADVIGVARPIVSHILSGRNKPSLEVVQRILAAMPDLAMPWLLNGTGPILTGTVAAPVLPVVNSIDVPAPVPASIVTSVPDPVAVPVALPIVVAMPVVEPPQGATTPALSLPVSVSAPLRASVTTAAIGTSIGSGPVPGASQQIPAYASTTTLFRARIPSVNRAVDMPKRFVANFLRNDLGSVVPKKNQPPTESKLGTPLPSPVAAPVQESQTTPVSLPLVEEVMSTTQALPAPDDENQSASLATALFAGAGKPIRRIVIFYRDGSFADYQPE